MVELITANKASDKETTCTSLLSMKVGGIEQVRYDRPLMRVGLLRSHSPAVLILSYFVHAN